MKTTVHTCDICRQSKSEEDIIPISISYQAKAPNNNYKHTISKSKDICKACLDKRGLLTEFPTENIDETVAKRSKAFDDRFVDLLCDLGVLFEN